MATYYVDDGGNDSDGSSWTNAYVSFASLIASVANALTTSGNIIYVGDDHDNPNPGASQTITGPTSGSVIIISADRTQATPTYKKGTGSQLIATGGSYNMTLDGGFTCYGIRVVAGYNISLASDNDESCYYKDCTFVLGRYGVLSSGNYTFVRLLDCTIESEAGSSTGSFVAGGFNRLEVSGTSFSGADRSGGVIDNPAGSMHNYYSGCDFSGASNADCELISDVSGATYLSNCKTKADVVFFGAAATYREAKQEVVNCGSSDHPSGYGLNVFAGTLYSSTSIYRSSGASIESESVGWIVTTTANCSEDQPLHTPWIYGIVAAGSKTFTLYITNDTANLKDSEVWLEVEYLATSDSAQWTTDRSDKRATITTTAADQTTESASTWVGLNDSEQGHADYRQVLSATVTIGEAGLYRCRVAVGKASITSSDYFYIDPKVTVS